MSGLLTQLSLIVPVTAIAGGGAVSGMVISETTQGYKVSKKLVEGGTYLSKFFNSSGSSSSVSSSSSTAGLSSVGSFFTSTYETIKTYLITTGESTVSAVKGISTNSKSFELAMLQDFQKSMGDSEELKDLAKNLHLHIPRFIKFLSNKNESKTFTELFTSVKLQKTQEALKVLVGDTKSSFQAQKGVSAYLVKELMKDPQNISKKISRFVDLIDKAKKKVQNLVRNDDVGAGSASNPYILTKNKLQSFLDKREDVAQDGGELGFLLEVGASQKGVDLGPLPTSVFSVAFDFFGLLSSKITNSQK